MYSIEYADKDDDTKMPAAGVLMADALDGEWAYVITRRYGIMDTSSMSVGSRLFVQNSGNISTTFPSTGQIQVVGRVITVGTNGRVQFGPNQQMDSAILRNGGVVECSAGFVLDAYGLNGQIVVQKGIGPPVHTARQGCVYYDQNAQTMYVNSDGATGWTQIGGGGGGNHNILSSTHPDTTVAAVARGDIIVGVGPTPKWERVAKGTSGTYLRSDGTDALWTSIQSGDLPSDVEKTTNKNSANGYAGLDASSKITGSQQVYGTGANTALEGNQKAAANGVASLDASSKVVQDPASRGVANGVASLDGSTLLPTAQLPTHDILTKHDGFPGGSTNFLRADGTWNAPAGGGSPPAWKGAIVVGWGNGDPAPALRHMQAAGVVSPTPTNITTSIARCAFFQLDTAITVNRVRWYGVGNTTGVYRLAVYRVSDGVQMFAVNDFNTASATWGSAAISSVVLASGVLYLVAIAVDSTGTTAGILALGPTTAATTGQMINAKNWPGNLDIDAGKIDPYAFVQFAVTGGSLPSTLPSLVNQAAWTGGMPALFFDNNSAA